MPGVAVLSAHKGVHSLCMQSNQRLESACIILQVHAWALWNAPAACRALCAEVGGNARGAADVAERVLGGTLEALLRGRTAGRTDPRARLGAAAWAHRLHGGRQWRRQGLT